jgi:hypothetical protein
MSSRILVVTLACLAMVVSAALAQDAPKAKADAAKTLTGLVKVEKDAANKVIGIKLTVKAGNKDEVYTVVIDDMGYKVAAKDGKVCKVTGTVEEKAGVKYLKATACEEETGGATEPAPKKATKEKKAEEGKEAVKEGAKEPAKEAAKEAPATK